MDSEVDIEGREPRSQRILRCEIVDPFGESHPCLIKNISSKGLGGSGCDELEAGQYVTIILPEIGTLTGCIRWSADGKFGVRLDDEIVPEKVRFVGARNEAAPNFRVADLHRPVLDTRRPGL